MIRNTTTISSPEGKIRQLEEKLSYSEKINKELHEKVKKARKLISETQKEIDDTNKTHRLIMKKVREIERANKEILEGLDILDKFKIIILTIAMVIFAPFQLVINIFTPNKHKKKEII